MLGVIHLEKSTNNLKTCFFISPIGNAESPTRQRTEDVFEFLVQPVLSELGYQTVRPDRIASPGSIVDSIINYLTDADLVVADLTDQNANVYYELGIRHATGKPIIHIVQEGDILPFDIRDFRAIFYSLDIRSICNASNILRESILSIENDPHEFHGIVARATTLRASKGNQPLSIRAYLSDDEPEKVQQITSAIEKLKAALDLITTEDPPAEKGSWWKSWVAKPMTQSPSQKFLKG